jgi:enoyl-[acyl-carrier protein] reductase I
LQQLANLLEDQKPQSVVHSLAHAPSLKTMPLLQTSLEAYPEAHKILAYLLISIAQATQPLLDSNSSSSSITTLSYLGAIRDIPGYNVMGPAKASLEGIVRGLAVGLAPNNM